METYVVGEFKNVDEGKTKRINQLAEQLSPIGYEFPQHQKGGYFAFRKVGRLESVITELLPFCERLGLDVEEFELAEYRLEDHSQRAAYIKGRIVRDLEPVQPCH